MMKRKMFKAALMIAMVAGCVGCGKKDVASTPVETYTMVDFLCDDKERETIMVTDIRVNSTKASESETKVSAQEESQAPTKAPVQKETQAATKVPVQKETQAATKAPVQKETQAATSAPSFGGASWMNKSIEEMSEDELMELAQASDEVIEQYMSKYSKEDQEGIGFVIALSRIAIEMEEQAKYAMKYEVSEAGVSDLVTFERAILQDEKKSQYPEGRAWKNKAGNIVIIDATTSGVSFTVSAEVGLDEDNEQAYLITVKYSDGHERYVEFCGSGICVLHHTDNSNGYMKDPYAKNLDEIVK